MSVGVAGILTLSALLGIFILLCTWTELVRALGRFLTNFFPSPLFKPSFPCLSPASASCLSQS